MTTLVLFFEKLHLFPHVVYIYGELFVSVSPIQWLLQDGIALSVN
jgi:hypothetical protein